jgi:para-aminobenzoate synthetase/4-amino-4-deoxychorismate lyase
MLSPGTVLLHDNAPAGGRSLLFTAPRAVLATRRPAEVAALLGRAEAALVAGAHVAGFLAYEAGLTFEERLAPLPPAETDSPLLWFGVFDRPREMSREEARRWLDEQAGGEEPELSPPEFSMTRETYGTAFRRAKALIAAGDIYQVNLTLRARFALQGDAVALYRGLCRNQPVAHGALVATGEQTILSLSPELFIESRGGRLVTRPMKGTAPRGRTPEEDAAVARELRGSEKARAENLMIVDLLRNDLGRIAETRSVSVPRLFDVETYRSFHALTSTIAGTLRTDVRLGAMLGAMFPCGSVTGAPKIRAMEIIHELETSPRGVYCGSIGYAAPGGDCAFNVAIRTAVIDRGGKGEIGTGGGIVADSDEQAEYEEALLKLRFFRMETPLKLIETLLWDGKAFALLDRHMRRLARSAGHFGMPFDETEAMAVLAEAVAGLAGAQRVRLLLGEEGVTVATTPLTALTRLRFRLAAERTNSADPLLFHKTTRRGLYDHAREASGVDEVVFRNERDELTEGSFTNLFVQADGLLRTPALSCGLLPGTLREELLATGRAIESVMTLHDLAGAEAIYLGNSVRGLVAAEWIDEGRA